MQTVIGFLTFVLAFAAALGTEHSSLASGFESLLEGIRDDMPCGFPLLGIGSLAPLSVSHKQINVDIPLLKVQGTVQNFTVNNLNRFEVLDTKHYPLRRKFIFSLYFDNIAVDTWYDLQTDYQESGWTIKVNGSGDASFVLSGVLLSFTAKYGINVVDSRVTLKNFKIVPRIEGAVSHIEGIFGNGPVNARWNKQLEKSVPGFINTFAESIAEKIEAILLPHLNHFLYQYNLNDVVGGANGNAVDDKKIKCEPKE